MNLQITNPKPDKSAMHLAAANRKALELTEKENIQDLKSIFFHYVKCIALSDRQLSSTLDELMQMFESFTLMVETAGKLTPRDIQEMFPIEKSYDGEKYQIKDYFTTKEMIDEMPEGKPIAFSKDPMSFLMDYMNPDIHTFVIELLCLTSKIRKSQGQKGLAEEYFEDMGVTPYYLQKDAHGKEYLYDPKEGKTFPVSKPKARRPKWIRVVH